jgi:hypothetical protein
VFSGKRKDLRQICRFVSLRCEEEGEAAIMVAVTEVADVRKNYGSVMELAGGQTVPDVFKINAKIEECRTVAAGGRAIPVVDLSGLHGEKRAELVEQMRAASEEWGFFQVCLSFGFFGLLLVLFLHKRILP